jgi:hypothetical protein
MSAPLRYVLEPRRPAPAGFPAEALADAHAEQCFAVEFEARRAAFLTHVARSSPPAHLAGAFHELARLAAGGPAHEGVLEAALDYVDQRLDCADFLMHAVLRLLRQFGESARVPAALLERARATALGFKYWPDEPGVDSMCSWTENHQILFAGAALVAGETFPDEVFESSGRRGRELAARARPRIDRWLELRFRTGFSEWLSNVYYDEDLTALASLVDFAADPELRRRAAMVLDLLLLDVGLHSFRGVFGSTHGRSYERSKKWAAEEGTTDTAKLFFGTGSFARRENQSAACLALSTGYRMPRVLFEIAREAGEGSFGVRQRMGIRVAEAGRWGLDLDSLEDGMRLLSLEAYTHPRTIALTLRLFDAFGWWENEFFRPFRAQRRLLGFLRRARLLPVLARVFERDLTRNLREEVNVLTWRTPDYSLSSAQDWRPGFGGDQQHLWQATLGPDAVVFTTHPGPRRGDTPDRWTGSGLLPRVGQVENVAVVVYSLSSPPALYVRNRIFHTHAWLPPDRFDEVVERGRWIFARRGRGYLALGSQHPWRWQDEPGEDRGRELIVDGRDQIWLCELGREADCGPFANFVARVSGARLAFGRRSVVYASPSQGRIEFGWRGPLRRRGEAVPLAGHPRYETPWGSAGFPMDELALRCGGHSLRLAWPTATRDASGFV